MDQCDEFVHFKIKVCDGKVISRDYTDCRIGADRFFRQGEEATGYGSDGLAALPAA